uniref:Programmed cell death 6-interacting protein n=1 Tax=Aceria tosichella TaxID=561515 RepID=A0A6G1S8F7_9ACAR
MTNFIAVPLKKTSDIDLVKPLKQLISTYYNGDESYNDSIEQLDKLRKDATFKGIENNPTSALQALQRYYDQLKLFASKCPINEVPINFKWKDAFDRGYSFLSSSSSLIIQSLAYERVCVLFNLAAAYSNVAATALNEDVHNEHALQLAAKYFQVSSGILLALKTEAPAALGQRSPQTDLNPSILDILHYLMLAQAQEAIYVKATQNNMSNANLAKVASQCSDYYGECYKLIQIVKSIWPDKEWFNQIQAKQLAYSAISDFHQSAVASTAKKFGEEISWLNHSVDSFKQAEAKSPLSEFLQTCYKKAVRRQEEAIKENDFIYHARVPEFRLLESVERFSLVKPAPLPVKFLPDTSDLFQGLLPLKAQQAWQKLEARKQEITGQEIASLQEASTTLNGVLASLNLPASLEDAPGVELPQSLQDKSKYVRQKGGVQYVSKLIGELPDLLKRNLEILDEIDQSIRNEENRDNAEREKFGKDKWTRTASSVLNKAWKDYVEKYRNIIKNAQAADEKVKEKFHNHEREIALLSNESKEAIANAIPSGYQGHNYSNAPCVQRLRQLMQEVASLKQSREDLENKFKNADFESIKSKFIETVNNEGSVDDSAMVAESLGKIFGPLQKEARDSKERQEALIKEIQSVNQDFVELKGGSQSSASERDAFFSRLAAAHDSFNDLLRHLQEGTKFYNDLTQLLVSLQSKVDDYCYARKTELEELNKTLDPSGSKSASSQYSSNTAGTTPSPAQPAQQPANAPPQPQAPNYFYPPPPLPNMPFSAYGTYHPGTGYPMPPQPNYYAAYPQGGYPPYNPYNTLPGQHPPGPGQQKPPSS